MQKLVNLFIATFQKALELEVASVRRQMGGFELELTNGIAIGENTTEKGWIYSFSLLGKINMQIDCSDGVLTWDGGEANVSILEINNKIITVCCKYELNTDPDMFLLTIYPYFIYLKLSESLGKISSQNGYFVESALKLFGKIPPKKKSISPLLLSHQLNKSQREAIKLCHSCDTAFIWGPPGTGKTTTIGHLVATFYQQKLRVLVTSTTNVAVDRALEKLIRLDAVKGAIHSNHIIRVGITNGKSLGFTLSEITNKEGERSLRSLKILQAISEKLRRRIAKISLKIDRLKEESKPYQLDLFGNNSPKSIPEEGLGYFFSTWQAKKMESISESEMLPLWENRLFKLNKMLEWCNKKVNKINRSLINLESNLIENAQIIFSTMTNMFVNPRFASERFDAVIIDEAGMATLPPLFYNASLARQKVVVVGDPRQLPPIVQSSERYVHRFMGRTIFEVTVEDPHCCNMVAMLNTQYRMHPSINNLVSSMFYEGKLLNGESTTEFTVMTNKKPYSGFPLIVVNTSNKTVCKTNEGSFSRFNSITAKKSIDLAIEAVRNDLNSVAVITPYVQQAKLLNQLLSRYGEESKKIRCKTVHRFQGNESDVVIFDTVDTHPMKPGILFRENGINSHSKKLINVAISRAKYKLIIIIDHLYFEKYAPTSVVTSLLQYSIKNGAFVDSMATQKYELSA